jgi:hypothetical protein
MAHCPCAGMGWGATAILGALRGEQLSQPEVLISNLTSCCHAPAAVIVGPKPPAVCLGPADAR